MISIAMATYNGAGHLREQINSILCQTIQDFELVICDDNSTDNTVSILYEIASNDKRIRIFENSQNIGFKKNFERAILKCRGDFIALSDQDDIWLSNHLEVLYNEMKPLVQIVCGKPLFVDENNIELPSKYDYLKMSRIPSNPHSQIENIFLGGSSYQGASMLVRKSFFKVALPIPDEALYHDSWFAAMASCMKGLCYVNKNIVRYRRYSNSYTRGMKRRSAFRLMIGATLFNHTLLDRLSYVQEIRKRESNLSPDVLSQLDEIEKLLKRRNSFKGRVMNFPYLLLHFKTVYASDFKHFFI